MESIANFYGWVQSNQARTVTAECVECGAEISQQAHATMYECERCINLREE